MKVFKEIRALKVFLKDIRLSKKSIGFVPTMGALHQGHMQLIHECKAKADITVVSIFVNPAQFNSAADFEKYPRIIDEDGKKLETAGCDVLFAPDPNEMYPSPTSINISFGHLDTTLEGAFRPGHFSGVALVVSKLFNIVEPDHAFFGQKDWQQFAVISKLVEDLSFPVQLHSVPTIREADGLAMSSRNLRLTNEQRATAPIFFQALTTARKMAQEKIAIPEIKIAIEELFAKHKSVTLEYFEIVDQQKLTTVKSIDDKQQLIICIAGWIGEIRLIDNIII